MSLYCAHRANLGATSRHEVAHRPTSTPPDLVSRRRRRGAQSTFPTLLLPSILPPSIGSPATVPNLLSAAWQAGLSNGAQVGEIFGLYFAGYAAERYGYRKTMTSALLAIVAFVFIQFFVSHIQTLQAAYILRGLPGGVFQTITTAYAAEARLFASGVLRGMLNVHNEWAYRACYGIQWFWPIPITIGVIFAPESQWWLVRKGRYQAAAKSIERLTTKGAHTNFNTEQKVAMMVHTNDMEKKVSEGTSYFDCLKHTDLRRTEIESIAWLAPISQSMGIKNDVIPIADEGVCRQ
ncbi:hypothetical protein V1508DRAFT_444592 [Lipomyces doorenjongii]|uniref:uncharacterized protein n=1 Tax=Lipomyces doorenjongii TaxID=383834 RepID=UPI0034CE0DA0